MNLQNLSGESPLVSIIIPARNEAEDIARTLDSCLAIDYEPKEIIVVDDSTDDTPTIVASYADRGVRLIHRENNRNGCCGARNLGMQEAKGEIIVLLNADNLPRPNFLHVLLPHYRNGADYVIVRSIVLNQSNLWGKFTLATGLAWMSKDPAIEWSEGFSCRKSAAEKVGYIPGNFPVPFCRDYMFGIALNQAGFNKHVDLSIPMEHIVPGTFSSYWQNQVWRGTFSAPHAYYFWKISLMKIWVREILKTIRAALKYLLLLPAIWRIVQILKFAPNGWRDMAGFVFAGLVQDIAIRVGNFKGVIRIVRICKVAGNPASGAKVHS